LVYEEVPLYVFLLLVFSVFSVSSGLFLIHEAGEV
jgi:hypothetical protein